MGNTQKLVNCTAGCSKFMTYTPAHRALLKDISRKPAVPDKQGDHSFSTMIFHDFSMTKKINSHDLSAQHISSKYTIHDI